jgi:hypothetical protein
MLFINFAEILIFITKYTHITPTGIVDRNLILYLIKSSNVRGSRHVSCSTKSRIWHMKGGIWVAIYDV